MTWTYGGDPSSSSRDEIRFLVGDTETTNQLVSDEEINYALTLHPKISGKANYEAAAMVATAIAGKFGSKQSKTVGTLSISFEEQHRKYTEMAANFTKLATSGIDGRGTRKGAPLLYGGGLTYLGPTDPPDTYEP